MKWDRSKSLGQFPGRLQMLDGHVTHSFPWGRNCRLSDLSPELGGLREGLTWIKWNHFIFLILCSFGVLQILNWILKALWRYFGPSIVLSMSLSGGQEVRLSFHHLVDVTHMSKSALLNRGLLGGSGDHQTPWNSSLNFRSMFFHQVLIHSPKC